MFAVLPFIVCLLVLLIIWIVVEVVLRYVTPPFAQMWIIIRAVFAILVILCILHALGVMGPPVSLS